MRTLDLWECGMCYDAGKSQVFPSKRSLEEHFKKEHRKPIEKEKRHGR